MPKREWEGSSGGLEVGLFVWLVVTCQVPWPLALRYLAVVWECFIILINAALEQCTISMLMGMRRTLTNEKRRSRRRRGAQWAGEEKRWTGMWIWKYGTTCHTLHERFVCVCSGEKENSNFLCIPDIMSCMFCVCVLLSNGVNECLVVYKSL